ncbi:MAG: hypothetical protein PHN31_00730 [Candidatus Gracilibacteria bacterium]|nr:hypothetical protein [Candidatus Gracilibacteria bacterium]
MSNHEKLLIRSRDELKKELSLDFEVYIPEFKDVLELTKQELIELREKIIKNKENSEVLRNTIKEVIIKKLRKETDIERQAREGLTEIQSQNLRSELETQAPKINPEQNNGSEMVTEQNNTIQSIDATKPLAEQKGKISELETGLALLLQRLGVLGLKKEMLNDYDKFNTFIELNKDKLDASMIIVAEKVKEILKTGNNEIKLHFTTIWSDIVKRVYPTSQEITEITTSQDTQSEISTKNKIYEYSKKHPYIASAIAVAGTYGVFKILGSIFGGKEESSSESSSGEKKEQNNNKGFMSSLFGKIDTKWKATIGSILGVFGLGQVLSREQVKKFFKDQFNFDVDENRVLKAIEYFSKGEILDGIMALIFGSDHKERVQEGEKFYQDVTEDMHNKGYTKDLREWNDTKILKKFSGEYTNSFQDGIGSRADSLFGLFGKDNPELSYTQALRKYIKEQTKKYKIEIKTDDTVEFTLKQILEASKKENSGSTSNPEQKPEEKKNNPQTNPVIVPQNNQQQTNGENKPVGVDGTGTEIRSLGNPVLYYWYKGTRFDIGKTHVRTSIRKYIGQLEENGAGLPETREKVKNLKLAEKLLIKEKLTANDKKLLGPIIDSCFKEAPKLFGISGLILSTDTDTFLESLNDKPELKEKIKTELEKAKSEAIKYHDEMQKLLTEKQKLVQDLDEQLRKTAEKEKFKIKDYFKLNSPVTKKSADGSVRLQNPIETGGNQFSNYTRLREEGLAKIEEIDRQITGMNGKMNETLEKTNSLFEKYNLPSEQKLYLKKGFFQSLESVGYVVNKVPLVQTGKFAFKLGFMGMVAGTIAREFKNGDDKWKTDATEVGLGLLPITSEILDFKAAFGGEDLSGRKISTKDRWIRAGFGVVGTVADAATLVSFGQSEWARAWLAGVRGGATVAEVANDAGKMNRLKQGIFTLSDSEKFLSTVKKANATGRIFSYGAMGVATYQVAHDITLNDVKEIAGDIKDVAVDTAKKAKDIIL